MKKFFQRNFKKICQIFNFFTTSGMLKTDTLVIGESGRLISDVIRIPKLKKLEGFLVAMAIEKAIDSLDHNFLISKLEKHDFRKNVIL